MPSRVGASNLTTLHFDLGSPVSGGTYGGDLLTIGAGGLVLNPNTAISFGGANPTVNHPVAATFIKNAVQKVLDMVPDGCDVVFASAHGFNAAGYFFLTIVATGMGGGAALLKKYCWKMPTILPVSQYNTRPLGAL